MEEGKLLTKEEILNAKDLEVIPFAVPSLGGNVGLRMMSGRERDEMEAALKEFSDEGGKYPVSKLRPLLLSRTIVDAKGERLFATPEDVEALGEKSIQSLHDLTNKAMEINELEKSVKEDVLKNSEAIQDEDSITDLR